ncbi:MAG: PKD domain-containing protein [Bacteroidetes bacterium]|nr:PKD domain-containing protein [Bacteroidota bacterium]
MAAAATPIAITGSQILEKNGSAGIFAVAFEVRDALGVVTADTVRITVHDTLSAPVALIFAPASTDTTIITGDSVRFEGFLSPAGAQGIRLTWLYGAGSGLAADSSQSPGWRTFKLAGTFSVSFTATDKSLRSSSDSLSIRVLENQAPVVSITQPAASAVSIGVGSTISFLATETDPELRPLTRVWTWGNGSGIAPAASDTSVAAGARTFTVAGIFPVIFSSTDDKGLTSADTVTISVVNNTSPLASITIPSADTTIAAWSRLSFAATDSDPDGSVTNRAWDFGADSGSGVSAAGDTSAVTVMKTFGIPGVFDILYTVTDNLQGSAVDTLRLTVLANGRPGALILSPGGQQSITAGDSLSFLATVADPDGTIVSQLWTFGSGSGIPDAAVTIPDWRTFSLPGNFAVIFTVWDNVGAVDADTVNVSVSP